MVGLARWPYPDHRECLGYYGWQQIHAVVGCEEERQDG